MTVSGNLNERRHNLTGKSSDASYANALIEQGQTGGAWSLYDALISDIPEDVQVIDYALGVNWSYLEAECGSGIAYTLSGGAKSSGRHDFRGRSLKEVATFAKSWKFEEATLGVAALNAWYGRMDNLVAMGAMFDEHCEKGSCAECSDKIRSAKNCHRATDAFDYYKPQIEKFTVQNGRPAKVIVVGHFPHVEDIAEYASLTVLERNCRNEWDTPDPACEYMIPNADYVFMTGVTLINKTMPRLLQLSSNASSAVVGPSAVASPALFEYGLDTIAGRCVVDPERAKFSAVACEPFASSLSSFIINRTK